ncbi:hypothetical protein [Rhodoferax sp.]|uniref:hypothetical protein n=1 Tax=Rhodoferax sp. TaxID=50421 RepID=UPI001EB7B5CD|nr:hypothetical protein [Rhodoferax sp.]MBT9505426.1 hypothetical protein [Rhodoferax sp.]
MKKLTFSTIAFAVSLAFGSGAMAQGISKSEYKTGKDTISADYKAAKTGCATLSGNTKDVCVLEAKGKEKIAKAELQASYKPSVKNAYEVRVAKADATYAVAKEKCDDLAGNAKDVCVKEAKATQVAAKADAKAQMKVTDANKAADEKSSDARAKASSETLDARNQAATDKLDAQYKVEKEKCDTFSGNAKDNCLAQAKVRFGKS